MALTSLLLALALSAPDDVFLEPGRRYAFHDIKPVLAEFRLSVSTTPQLLLVVQSGVDAVVACDGVPRANAPLGRHGIEAVLLRHSTRCKLVLKAPQSPTGSIHVSAHPMAGAVMGMGIGGWSTYAAALTHDFETNDGRARAIALLDTLRATSANSELRLSLDVGLANLKRLHGHHTQALDVYQSVLPLLQQHPAWSGPIYNGMGRSYFALQKFEAAEQAFSTVIASAKESQPVQVAAAQNNLCLLLQQRDELEDAQVCYERAVAQFEQLGEIEFGSAARVNWAQAAQRAGDPAAAESVYLAVYQHRKSAPRARGLSTICLHLASLYAQLGDYGSALRYSREAMEVAEALQSNADVVRAMRVHADSLLEIGDRSRAESYLQTAARLAANDPPVLAGILADRADLSLAPADALKLHAAARDMFARANSIAGAMQQSLAYARKAIELGDVDMADQELAGISPSIASADLVRQATYALARAELAFARGEVVDERVFDLPLERFAELRDRQMQGQAGLLKAKWLLRERRHRQALDALLAVAALRHSLQQAMPTLALAASFYGQRAAWNSLALQLPVSAIQGDDSMAQFWQALDSMALTARYEFQAPPSDLRRYRLLAAQLSLDASAAPALRATWRREIDELELKFSRSTFANRSQSLDAWRRALSAEQRLVRFLVGPTRGRRFTVGQGGIAVDDFDAAELERRVADARTSGSAADALAALLLPDQLDAAELLLVMPDGALHDVPWMALAQRHRPNRLALVLDAPVAPSAQALDPLPSAFRVLSLEFAAERPLPGVTRGRRELALRLADRFIAMPATSSALPSADVLHLAGHGWVSQEFLSASALSGDAPATKNAQTWSFDQFRFAQAPRLVYLSACDSASADRYGAGVSMARAIAGRIAGLVVAPMEPIPDASALNFEREFFVALDRHAPLRAFAATLAKTRTRNRPLPPWQIFLGTVGDSSASSQTSQRASAR